MPRLLAVILISLAVVACDTNQRKPSPPPVPDIPLPSKSDAGEPSESEPGTNAGSAEKDEADDLRAPIAANLLEFVPEVLDGVRFRRRQAVDTAPIVHGFYQGEKRKIYNLHLTGPTEQEATRRAKYPLLGKDETEESGPLETKGFKIGEFEGQRTYDSKKQKSEAVVLVNRFVEVKLSVAPTDKADEATKLIETIDLVGASKLR